jgi:hypothetical protein
VTQNASERYLRYSRRKPAGGAPGIAEAAPAGAAPSAPPADAAGRPRDAADAVRVVRDNGGEAYVAHVVPLGHVVKGDDVPIPTMAMAGFPAETVRRYLGSKPVPVAVIDNGIGPERTDGWLTSVGRSPDPATPVPDPNGSNTDPLDVFGGAPNRSDERPDGELDIAAGHGTFVSGVIQQVCPGCEIRVYRAADSDGMGSEFDLGTALRKAADDRAQLIHLSMGMTAVDGAPPVELEAAVRYIQAKYPDVVIVASAGNVETTERMYPAGFPGVIAVAALDKKLQPAPWSTRGEWVTFSCVGVGVASTYVEGVTEHDLGHQQRFGPDPWALWSGTSFSAPQVTGALADLMMVERITAPQAVERLLAEGRRDPALPDFGVILEILPGN